MFDKNGCKKILSQTKGQVFENFGLSDMTWFGVGGNADFLFYPRDNEDIEYFLKEAKNIPILVLGGCSNVLIRDGGIKGCVLKLGKEFSNIKVKGNKIYCGGGASNVAVAKTAYENGIGGFEFLRDIPGTVGGAVRMNAGCHGREIKDIAIKISGFDKQGKYISYDNSEMGFSYRKTDIADDFLFVDIAFEGYLDDMENIKNKMDEYREKRKSTQPMGVKTCGSTFKNPSEAPAWKLIDEAGCKGMQIGGAKVSEKHCNFLINEGNATAKDIEDLGNAIIEKVYNQHKITLEWEIKRLGY